MITLHTTRRKNFKPITEEMAQELTGALVGVHWNAHEKCWSVVAFNSRKTEKKVIGHTDRLVLEDITFKVSLSKKKAALEKGKKDRHTFIVGIFAGMGENITSNQSKGKFFYDVSDNEQPFKDVNGHSLIGENAYFSRLGRVFRT